MKKCKKCGCGINKGSISDMISDKYCEDCYFELDENKIQGKIVPKTKKEILEHARRVVRDINRVKKKFGKDCNKEYLAGRKVAMEEIINMLIKTKGKLRKEILEHARRVVRAINRYKKKLGKDCNEEYLAGRKVAMEEIISLGSGEQQLLNKCENFENKKNKKTFVAVRVKKKTEIFVFPTREDADGFIEDLKKRFGNRKWDYLIGKEAQVKEK